ncbi:MAG: carboxypeptidase regulatory-like domain-containing protein, partial [Candidatus Cloacimonetes bacterium]|nr:carboxypeptidase regulatory-like domain-containing protein [Candidatus Cloacimonadota bacterium]
LNAASKDNPVRNEAGLVPRLLFHLSERQLTGFAFPSDDPDYKVVTYDIAMDANLFGGIDGTVIDIDTGLPLEGAHIFAVSLGGYEYNALTDNTGYYSIVDVVAETYDVYCDYPNYPTDVEEDVIVQDGQTTTVDFELEGYSYWNDFENDDGGFISNNPAGWQWGIPSNGPSNAYSGDKLWGTVLDNDYPNEANFTVDSPEYYLIPSFNPILFFHHWYNIENSWDGGNVKISSDGGLSWSVIEPINGYTGTANSANPLYPEEIFCGTSSGWEYVEFDLSSYIGQNIIFRWHFGSDSTVTYPGWFIDDFGITGFSSGFLFGTVTEFGSGNPIEGATVSIIGTELNNITEADGTYVIMGTWPSVFDISCVAPLYLDAEELNFNIANVVTTLDFSLFWSEMDVSVTELICYLPPDTTGTLSFFITNNGPGDLEYNITVEYTDEFTRPENWLGEFTNVSGTVPGNGGSVMIMIPINTEDLIAGEVYTANLVIHNNSNYTTTRGDDYVIPVTLNVGYVNTEHHLLPFITKLKNNYPNPFNPVTNIAFSIKEAGNVTLEIYNLRGQLVKTLINEAKETGEYTASWNGTDNSSKPVSSGVYLYKIKSGIYTNTKKMILMK